MAAPISAAAAQAGAMEKSLPKNARISKNPTAQTWSTQGTARIAKPAVSNPAAPTSRRPHRVPQRRMIASEIDPPTKQAIAPNPKGKAERLHVTVGLK